MRDGHLQEYLYAPRAHKGPLQLPLFGILTLCCSCFRLKTEEGRWTRRVIRQEDYPDTGFSHGLCPSCFRRLYPTAYRHRRRS